VALNRPAYLSSTLTLSSTGWTFVASSGNDGDKSNCHALGVPNSLVHTEYELNPWYGVDLGVPLHVTGVKLTNRRDCKSFSYITVIRPMLSVM